MDAGERTDEAELGRSDEVGDRVEPIQPGGAGEEAKVLVLTALDEALREGRSETLLDAGGGATVNDLEAAFCKLDDVVDDELELERTGKDAKLLLPFTPACMPLLLLPVSDGVKIGVPLGTGVDEVEGALRLSHDMTSSASPPAGISLAT